MLLEGRGYTYFVYLKILWCNISDNKNNENNDIIVLL